MIGVYDYTVLLTYLGFASGVAGIANLLNGGNVFTSVICLMFAGLCDMFDGKVARTKKKRTTEEKHFGIQLDSLSDLVCFGVLPASIGYVLCKNPESVKAASYLIKPLVILFPLAGLIRLAWFNVLEITRNSNTPVKEYTGLPITSSALICPFVFIFRGLLGKYFALVYSLVLLVVGLLFIVKIKIKKPGIKTMILFIIIGVIEILLIVTVRRLL